MKLDTNHNQLLQAVVVEPEIMTPVQNYLIYHSNTTAEQVLIATVSRGADRHTVTITLLESNMNTFGVSARNLAGQSEIAFSEEISESN